MVFYPLEGVREARPADAWKPGVLLGLNEARTAKSPAGLGGASGIPTGCEVGLGAGVGFEPTTFRL